MSRELKILMLMYVAAWLIAGAGAYLLWKEGAYVDYGSWRTTLTSLLVRLPNAACALWLWMCARRDRWLWALFGLAGNLFAIIIFLVVERLALLKQHGSTAQTD